MAVSQSFNIDDDISSSCQDSEEEIETQIKVSLITDGTPAANRISSFSDEEDSDTESSSPESSASEMSFRPKRQPSIIDIDGINEDIVTVDYTPTIHEMLPDALPVPPLPDSSSLPQEALQLVGEIMTILPGSVTVRGSGLSSSSARERRDAVLNEGSLLLLDDRTPLGYVSDTFGPTTLPHYLVRVERRESTGNTPSAPHSSTDDSSERAEHHTVSNSESISQSRTSLTPPSTPSPHDYLDTTKIFVSRPVYHIPSLSNFVFPNEIARIKGSDASNPYDEEVADHEKDFSDDEAEKLYKRIWKGTRSPSQTPLSNTVDDDDSASVVHDEASSLYGVSPYDFEYISTQLQDNNNVAASSSVSDSPVPSVSLTNFEDAAVHDALMLARKSRNRRHTSVSISEVPSAMGSSRPRRHDHQPHGRGGRGGRSRGKDRSRSERGRERSSRGQLRGHDRRRGGPGAVHEHGDGERQKSTYSFEEYDPHMPRLPSPTSMAIARATGQWTDGTPFPYSAGPTGGASVTGTETRIPQTADNFQGHMPMHYHPEPYGTQGYYNTTAALPQTLGYPPFHVGNYGVAPHVNPRFAQAFSLPSSTHGSSVASQNDPLDTPIMYPPSEQVFRSGD